MDRSFEGQVALVTGGGKGIGLAIARALAGRGAKVAVSGRDQRSLHTAAELTGGLAVPMDVRNESSVLSGVASAVEWGGQLHLLVNNAGIGLLDTPLLETTAEAWRDVLETNLTGSFLVAKAAWPHLVASKGQVLNVSSIAGSQGFAGASAYCSAKHGLNGLTEVLKKEGARVGVRAMALCPGAVDTELWGEWAGTEERGRMMSPAQVAELAMSMLSCPRNLDLGPLTVVNAIDPWSK